MALSCLVVFVTTYVLILPAFTLEKDTALQQGGIDVPVAEETLDTEEDAETVTTDADTAESTDETEEITEEIKVIEDTAVDADVTDDAVQEADTDKLTYKGEDYQIAVTDERSVLPSDASLAVAEIDKDLDADIYEAYCDSALAAIRDTDGGETVKELRFAKLYDIALISEGEEVEPEDPVSVRIDYDEAQSKSLKAENTDALRIVHFVENSETGEVEAQVLDQEKVEVNTDNKDKLTDATFDAGSFSVYAIVYTVDFHWNIDGKEFEYSIPGGDSIDIVTLVQTLGIIGKDDPDGIEAAAFAAEIESAEFSNPELVWVGKTEEETTVGDLKEANELECEYSADLTEDDIAAINAKTLAAGSWNLISLKPFDTEESLTITMKNGDQFVVKVTDAAYDATLVTNLNGATGALINRTRNNAVLGTALNSNHLQAIDVTVNGNQITTADGSPDLTEWTFNYVGNWNNNNYYTISCDSGYLNIGGNGGDSGFASVSDNPQNLIIRTRTNNGVQQIRIGAESSNRTYALNNTDNITSHGYGGYGNWGWNDNPGEWFTVYDLAVPQIGNVLDGKSLAIINNRDGGSNWQALRDEIDSTKDGRGYYVSGNGTTYTNEGGVDYSSSNDVFWTFEFVRSDSTGSYYRIHTDNGYLAIDPNVTKKSDMPSNQSHSFEHALHLEDSAGDGSANDPTLIRIVPNGDGTYLLQNRNGVCLWNYGNNQFWLSTQNKDNESTTSIANSKFRLAERPVVHHVTVHYVDRNGNELTGITYTGSNSAVVANQDGTFTIPYDISGNVDVRANFNFDNVIKEGSDPAKYTYGSTHLAGDGDWSELTYEGYLIDSLLTASNGDLIYHSDSGETSQPYAGYDPGNREYQTLRNYSLSGVANKRPSGQTGQIPYAQEVDKDIYVILDPLPGPSAASPSGGPDIDAAAPDLSKTMKPNNDGTYTLSLKVDAHGKNLSETNKANILFIVDTSSSMRKVTTNNHNRIEDTQEAVLGFGQDLLAYNNNHPDAVQLSMITFDGSVVDRLPWTTDTTTFENSVNTYLEYPYLHQGTDWEDALKRALEICQNPPDDDPTFVVFFTDGEPSQYTNFQGAQKNPNSDPTGHYTGQNDDPGTTYPNFYSYFLCRESSKDEMRAIVDTGVQLYGIYAYNPPPANPYVSYLGSEGGAQILHNALKYGYNTDEDLTNDVFYDAQNTDQVQKAFDKIFNSITEKVGFSNVVVEDGIAAGVTSTTVLEGDVSAFTYIIRDNNGAVAYKVTVAPNGVPDGQTVEDGTPIFTIGSGPPVIGEKKIVSTTKIKKDASGTPILDGDGNFQTETVDVEVYYYKDDNNKEYIMPISTASEHVSWDLSPLGLLKDGYSYEVNFVVWPNQESYDLVADLNNGKRQDIEATGNWENCPIKTDSAGRQYRQGGFPDYPYISRYESNGVYSAMSNTDQKVDYYRIDKKIVNGEEVTIISHDSKDVPPPDPMPLTASYSRIEKLWDVERDPGIFAQYLYNTDGSSKGFTVDFDVFQGNNLTDAYTNEFVGWVYDLDNNGNYIYLGPNESGDYVWEIDDSTGEPTGRKIKGHYVWAPGDTMSNVTYAGHAHQIGTRWVTDFSIATGLMLTNGEMERLGLNKSLYPSAELDGLTYYILEPGHDYTIKEHQVGTIGYEFDFESPVYHPMLVDGVLKNVEITYTYKQDPEHPDDPDAKVIDTATLTSITGSSEGLSGLEVQNILRGYINLNKIVVDEDGEVVEGDDTKFEYTIKLESPTSPGPFEGDHIPWYGINGLFYNDGNENYYQVYEAQGGVWMIKNEAGKEYEVTSTGFDPDEAGAQTVHYTVNGQPKEITLYGNQMTASSNGTIATATLAITQNETLYIANVPVGTEYTITEANTDDYTLIDILKEVKNGTAVEKSEHVSDLSDREATGTIVTNRDNHVTYTNKVLTGALKITKEIQKNGTTDTSATGTFYYAVYDKEYDPNADPPMEPVRTGSIEVTTGGTAEVTEGNLKVGKYYVYELTGEGGTPVTSGGIFSGGKYFAVSTTGSPATVTLGNTSEVDIINNYETIPVEATKSWADNNPDHITVYFKLFYKNAAGVDVTTGTPLEELTYGVTSVNWPEMPKYDENGNEYTYIVREYVLDEENGEFTENGHRYTEAAPNGYVNSEVGLTVTNSKLETYDPETTYSGIKLWVDTVNGSKTRPDGLNVTLMIDTTGNGPSSDDVEALDENGQPYQMAWVALDDDEWKYTFHHLPMFDEDKQIINYYAVETPINGYEPSVSDQINTNYEYKSYTLAHTENDAYPVMSSDADLVYTAVRIQHEGHLHHIWTQRVPTDEEKTRLVALVNEDLTAQHLPANATVENVHWVDGLPINHEFVWKAQPNGYKVSFTRYNTNTIHVQVDNHGAFSNICYGTLQYNYTAGSTNFQNELQPTTYTVEKTWGNGVTPPEGAVAVIELQGTVQRPLDPQPEGATETEYQEVSVDLAAIGVTQKIQVTLNGGTEGGDDTAQDPWKYTWENLPQYNKEPDNKDPLKITYSVKEISYTIGGHTVNLKDFAPDMDDSEEGTTIVTNQIPSFSFDILKIDAGSAATLKGAKFTLQQIQPTSNVEDPTTIGDPSSSTPAVTGDNGKVSFNNIPYGYYEVWEKERPTGYISMEEGDDKFYIRVDTDGVKLLEKVIADGDTQPKLTFREVQPGAGGVIKLGNVTLSTSGNNITLTMENTSGAELPYTGGIGTTIFYILGSILVLVGGIYFVARRRIADQ